MENFNAREIKEKYHRESFKDWNFRLKRKELEWLIEQAQKGEEYQKAYDYVEKAIYTQHCTMNHMENTEYEKGQINGLITASNIVEKAFKDVIG